MKLFHTVGYWQCVNAEGARIVFATCIATFLMLPFATADAFNIDGASRDGGF